MYSHSHPFPFFSNTQKRNEYLIGPGTWHHVICAFVLVDQAVFVLSTSALAPTVRAHPSSATLQGEGQHATPRSTGIDSRQLGRTVGREFRQ